MKKLTTAQQMKRNNVISFLLKFILFVVICTGLYFYLKNYLSSGNKEIAVASNNINFVEPSNVQVLDTPEQNIIISEEKTSTNIDITPISSEKKDTSISHIISIKEETISTSTNFDLSSTIINDTQPKNSIEKESETTTAKSTATIPEEVEQAYIERNNQIHEEAQKEIAENNQQIEKLKIQQELLQAIKDKYEAKKAAVEEWYNNEYTNYSNLLSEAQSNLKNAGGEFTDRKELSILGMQITSLKNSLQDSGINPNDNSEYKALISKQENLSSRYNYTQQVNEYSYYLNTTLPSKKTGYLLSIFKDYEEEMNEFQQTYNQ